MDSRLIAHMTPSLVPPDEAFAHDLIGGTGISGDIPSRRPADTMLGEAVMIRIRKTRSW